MKLNKKYIDISLTPKNAEEKGYKYVDDIIYGSDMRGINILLDLLNNDGCKLGTPKDTDLPNSYGIYIPDKS